jgi:hypothetical protein
MSIRFNNQYFTFNKAIEKHDDLSNPKHSYMKISISSSRKRSDNGERIYSDWFAIVHGDAINAVSGFVKGDFFSANGSISRTPFRLTDGSKKWPEAEINIFQVEKYVRPDEPVPAPLSEPEFPF